MDQSVTIIIVHFLPNTNMYSHYIVCVSFPLLYNISYYYIILCHYHNNIPYSAKFWWDKTLTNLGKRDLAEENFGKSSFV